MHNFIPSRLLDSRARTGTLYFLLRRLPFVNDARKINAALYGRRLFFYCINYVVSIAHSVTSPFFNHASMLTHLRVLHELCLNSS